MSTTQTATDRPGQSLVGNPAVDIDRTPSRYREGAYLTFGHLPADDSREYRRFDVREDADAFYVIELQPTRYYPLNWTLGMGETREGAWHRAQRQTKPVTVIDQTGARRSLGVVFTQEAKDRADYASYVSQGFADTDGYYAPLSFDHWMATRR